MSHGLYRLYDAEDRLLYVGISQYPQSRIETHRRSAPWRAQIARHKVVRGFPSRKEAAFAESEAINTEFPLYNKQGRRTEPKSVTIARAEARDAAKGDARQLLRHRARSAAAANTRLSEAIAQGRRAGLPFPELAELSGRSTSEVRTIAKKINGHSRTQAEIDAKGPADS